MRFSEETRTCHYSEGCDASARFRSRCSTDTEPYCTPRWGAVKSWMGRAPRFAAEAAGRRARPVLFSWGWQPPDAAAEQRMHLRTAVALSLWPASFRPANVAAWQRQAGSTRPRPNPPGVSEADVAVLARAAAQAIEPVAWSDERYPTALRAIFDPPPLIWLRGNSNALGGVSVGIVGSRRASVYGLQVAEQLSHELATYGITVVSGLARGADAAAHRGALTARGATTAVLGSGCDVMYPPEHAGLAARDAGTWRHRVRVSAGHAASAIAFSATESHHLGAVPRGRGRRGRRAQWDADHGPLRSRAGPRGHGGSG